MAAFIVLAVFGLIFLGIGKYLYGVLVGAKQAWNERVVPAAKERGLRTENGAHGFTQLVSEQPDGNATAFVNNGVASEASVAEHLRHFNTNAWLTIVTRPWPGGKGPQFKVDSVKDVPASWSPRAKELMQRSGTRFSVVSGGERVTIVTTGVVDKPAEVLDMVDLSHELAKTAAV